VLGHFHPPLIVTNCNLIGRAEAFASNTARDARWSTGLMMGLGFTLVLVALGGSREVVGQATLFAQAHMMFGEAARGGRCTWSDNYRGFLRAILPPGAFIGLGADHRGQDVIDARLQRRAQHSVVAEPVAGSGVVSL